MILGDALADMYGERRGQAKWSATASSPSLLAGFGTFRPSAQPKQRTATATIDQDKEEKLPKKFLADLDQELKAEKVDSGAVLQEGHAKAAVKSRKKSTARTQEEQAEKIRNAPPNSTEAQNGQAESQARNGNQDLQFSSLLGQDAEGDQLMQP